MAGASDKARFYLEQSVPELRDLERRKLFTREEITAITRKRSDFEHILCARGSTPADYARYATYESNLLSLTKKRALRLGAKGRSIAHTGQRRIFFILDRGTRKFHGDVGLWMQYIEYCQHNKAHKKLLEVFTKCLRLHPMKSGLWIHAARWALESQADMSSARSYMQRGLRFCQNDLNLWVQYAKLEMVYIAKIGARHKILGLNDVREEKKVDEADDPNADTIALPDVTAEDVNPKLQDLNAVDETALQNLASTPALTGAIPLAIFDAAMKQFENDPTIAETFFEAIAEFDVACRPKLLQHIIDHMSHNSPTSVALVSCEAKLSLVGIEPTSADLPLALGQALQILKAAISDELDEDVAKVVYASIKNYVKVLAETPQKGRGGSGIAKLVAKLRSNGRNSQARALLEEALKVQGDKEELQQLLAVVG
ncbi:U3 snoRNP protein [Elasticomyces elasticus]|nr:U3 snoRNP protein [Elasticomyces elasticus]KAK4987191.1 U3 snoRNP protein [Elasticomyces elasticus]